MKVSEALESRLSIRDFSSRPVPMETIRRVLTRSARAPSGGNLQPWHLDVVIGDRLSALKQHMAHRLAETEAGARSEAAEYDIYPKVLPSPYRDYRHELGEDMYRRLGIARDDKAGLRSWFARNYQCFGAPMALFCSVDRRMGAPQWSDLGMLLQSVMLLLREEGLDSCAQECWAVYPATISRFLEIPAHRMLFTGMSIGYRNADHPVNALRSRRAPIDSFVRFHGIDAMEAPPTS